MTSSPTITTLFDDDDSPNESFYVPDDAPDIRVVSQSQSTKPFDHLPNAVALRVEEINSPTAQDTTALHLEAYADDGMNYQVPQPTLNRCYPLQRKVFYPYLRHRIRVTSVMVPTLSTLL